MPPYAYPPPHEEQFNAQRFGLMELMLLARQSGRVLVIKVRLGLGLGLG